MENKTLKIDVATIRAELARNDIRKTLVAKKLNITPTILSRKLKEHSQFKISELGLLAELTKKPIDYFLKTD